MHASIQGPEPGDSATCERLLRGLPDWFGIESSLMQYAREVADLPAFTAIAGRDAIGLLSLRQHFPETAEVHLIAVARPWHSRGVGRSLLLAAEAWLRARGTRLLQVKTLGPSRQCAQYARTRSFYQAAGFLPVEEFPTLWSPANPCLLLVKPL
jgi:GNAT superfamily N-acetyltransferase